MNGIETTLETTLDTALLVLRPGDVLFVMPVMGETWTIAGTERIAAIVQDRLSENRVIVLPNAATFATVAMESRDDANQP